MTWSSRYIPPDAANWQGRPDTPPASSFFQLVQLLPLPFKHSVQTQSAFVLLGFCCDEGIRRNKGRIGAADGPRAIRQVLAKLPIQRPNIICYDAGDITCTDGDLESAQQALGQVVALLLQHGMTPIILGGGHETAWGHYQGIAACYSTQQLGILNFDAHFDMRPLLPLHQGSSGTPFLQIASDCQSKQRRFDYHCIGIQASGNISLLFETAKQHQVHTLLADDLHENNKEKCQSFMQRLLTQNDLIYLTLCLDVLAAAFAPGVSAPQSYGLTPWQLTPLLRQAAQSGKVISYDMVELSPHYDIDQRTAKLAAHFIYEIIHHHDFKRTLSC
jgi:formiminoglutamase